MDIFDFCKNPSGNDFRKLNFNTQSLFYTYSKKCINDNIGNIDLARKILQLYESIKTKYK